jgi:phage terminase large subunit
VIQQINTLKGVKIKITARSVNLLKEIKNYKFKVDRDGKVLDDVVKVNDDAMDAGRYASIFLLNMGATMAKYY